MARVALPGIRSRLIISIALTFAAVQAWLTVPVLRAQETARIEVELLIEPGSASTSQSWLNLLKDVVPSGLRIRQGTSGEKLEVIRTGPDKSPSYRVIGLITREGLVLPNGKTYTMSDKRSIAAWLAKVPETANNEPGSAPAAFGLSEKQLISIHQNLSVPVAFSTKGIASREAIEKLSRTLTMAIEVSANARESYRSEEPVLDELEGVSGGTALAALLRPLGLVFAPEQLKKGADIRLKVADVRELQESWPIGWPVEQQVNKAAPELFKFLNADISDTPLEEALSALQSRVKYPFLRDHNSIVRHRIDFQKIRVNLPGNKTFYKSILDRILSQGKLKCEIRVDEADKPFLWISTVLK